MKYKKIMQNEILNVLEMFKIDTPARYYLHEFRNRANEYLNDVDFKQGRRAKYTLRRLYSIYDTISVFAYAVKARCICLCTYIIE